MKSPNSENLLLRK